MMFMKLYGCNALSLASATAATATAATIVSAAAAENKKDNNPDAVASIITAVSKEGTVVAASA